jgi:peptide/nickel transport system permease protein
VSDATRAGRRLGVALLAGLLCAALFGDLLASDLPLACRIGGALYVLPCVRRPAALAGEDIQRLRARLAPGDWLLAPPVPYAPTAQHPGGRSDVLDAPSRAHWLGTDDRGRDVLSRLIHGTRVAAAVGPLAVALYLAVGTACGLSCALSPALDAALLRLIELGLAFPTLFLLLALQGLLGAASLAQIAAVIAVAEWPGMARLVRAEARRVLASPHVEAARALGVPPPRLLLRHVLPLAMAPALMSAAFGVGQAVLFESALSFLGFGVPPPTASWGELLAQAQAAGGRPWLLVPPAVAIGVTVLACNLVGRALLAAPATASRAA